MFFAGNRKLGKITMDMRKYDAPHANPPQIPIGRDTFHSPGRSADLRMLMPFTKMGGKTKKRK
jgi:hypothetical protein